MRGFAWWKLLLTLVVSVGALLATGVWLEHRSQIDQEAQRYKWGEGPTLAKVPPDEMILVSGGEYIIGDDSPEPADDAPPRRIQIDSFYIDRHEVTNREFERFVTKTGYLTTAEREGGAWVYKGGERDWTYLKGANWRHPIGVGTSTGGAMDHPVVLVSWLDANAYAQWAGKRLPTEAEWEVAARGSKAANFPGNLVVRTELNESPDRNLDHAVHNGKDNDEGARHPSAGDHSAIAGPTNVAPDGKANIWQGNWPDRNEMQDGYFYTSPVGAFPPNQLGLYDMIGNVWEWTADWYASDTYRMSGVARNPIGPTSGTLRVARGGSWFCSANYCGAYRAGFRGKSPPNSSFNNVGFRCARDVSR